jgi:hypothetical protein
MIERKQSVIDEEWAKKTIKKQRERRNTVNFLAQLAQLAADQDITRQSPEQQLSRLKDKSQSVLGTSLEEVLDSIKRP